MNLAIGILVLWVACALMWVAAHGLDAKTPYEAYQKLMAAISGAVGADEGGTGGEGGGEEVAAPVAG